MLATDSIKTQTCLLKVVHSHETMVTFSIAISQKAKTEQHMA